MSEYFRFQFVFSFLYLFSSFNFIATQNDHFLNLLFSLLDNEVYLGDEPASDSQSGEFCTQPEPPKNGRFVCLVKNPNFKDLLSNLNGKINETQRTLAPGSTCHVLCNRGYSIPHHLNPLTRIECASGAWNTTNIEYCYKRQPQRRHLTHDHRNKETHT